ncbi:hypothetical protein [Methylobacterium nodulans]|uniref:Uncharacterized protein n=1 Tax=Methylobacterium nodulans (strain LMG 21967 / CNCM I-2342 / ORS 2060) TaxID=460265 RepID=B8IW94_METNO|nr:hypothetical protein [Methylobacterium nodulans]ACL62684.1 conserved hypothetical protein [Methylobacterium nodulans ORS 2060]
MTDTSTVGTLIARNIVPLEQLDAAVSAYMADPALGPRETANGVSRGLQDEAQRLLVWTAILLTLAALGEAE